MKDMVNIAAAAVGVLLLILIFAIGPTASFIGVYRATGSESVAGIANGMLRAFSWPVTSMGYHPDSRDDTGLLACLRAAGVDPKAIAANPTAFAAQTRGCAGAYEGSRIDLSDETQAQFRFRMMPPSYADPQTVLLHFTNEAPDKVVLGVDVFIHDTNGSEHHFVPVVAYPGQFAAVPVKVALLSDIASVHEFGFSAVPTIARVKDITAYGYAPPAQ